MTYGARITALVLAASFVAGHARADVQACFDASLHGQELQRAGKLLAARDQYAVCGRSECPREVAAQCTAWLKEVELATPSIVIRARNASGQDLTDLQPVVDGAARPETSLGRSLPLDPGKHSIRCTRPDGSTAEQTVILVEGEKGRVVEVPFDSWAPPPPPPSTPSRSLPPLFYVLAATSLAGAGTFAYFGATGYDARKSFGCDVQCSAAHYSEVRRDFVIADVGLAVSALAAAGSLWILFRSRRTGGSE
jgi:hypothetical protein